jgi:hypothetical protein
MIATGTVSRMVLSASNPKPVVGVPRALILVPVASKPPIAVPATLKLKMSGRCAHQAELTVADREARCGFNPSKYIHELSGNTVRHFQVKA